MFWLRNKKNNFQLSTFIRRPATSKGSDKHVHLQSLAIAFVACVACTHIIWKVRVQTKNNIENSNLPVISQ